MENISNNEEENRSKYSALTTTKSFCDDAEGEDDSSSRGSEEEDGEVGSNCSSLPPPIGSISFSQQQQETINNGNGKEDGDVYDDDRSSQFLMDIVACRATREDTTTNSNNKQEQAKSPPPSPQPNSRRLRNDESPATAATRPGAVHVPGINNNSSHHHGSSSSGSNSNNNINPMGCCAGINPEDENDVEQQQQQQQHDKLNHHPTEGYWGASSNRSSQSQFTIASSTTTTTSTTLNFPPRLPPCGGSDNDHSSSTAMINNNNNHDSTTTTFTRSNNSEGSSSSSSIPVVPVGIPLAEDRLRRSDHNTNSSSDHHYQQQQQQQHPQPQHTNQQYANNNNNTNPNSSPLPPPTDMFNDITGPPLPPLPLLFGGEESAVAPPAPTVVTTAFAVNDQELEGDIRRRIIEEAVSAQLVLSMEEADAGEDESTPQTTTGQSGTSDTSVINSSNKKKKKFWIFALSTCIAFGALVGGISIAIVLLTRTDSSNNTKEDQHQQSISDTRSSPSSEQQQQQQQQQEEGTATIELWNTISNNNDHQRRPTIELIRERGYLVCGLYAGKPGFSLQLDDTDDFVGINIDQCGALALAVLGDPNLVEHVVVTSQTRLPMLANGSIDILSSTATHTMGRDVYDSPSNSGFSFSIPYLYTGMNFVGVPSFVTDCAEKLDTFYGPCRDLRVCAGLGTTHHYTVLNLLPGSAVVPTSSQQEQADFLMDGTCNVIATEPAAMPESLLRGYGYEGPFRQGTYLFSKEPLTLVTRQNDPEWSSLVDLIVNIFYLAESKNITKTDAGRMRNGVFVNSTLDMTEIAVSIVSEFGNYGDLYNKHLKDLIPRDGLNRLYNNNNNNRAGGDGEEEAAETTTTTAGLLYSHPFGNLEAEGPGPIVNSTLQKILDRGHLRCGVIPRPGFAAAKTNNNNNGSGGASGIEKWYGFDVELCRGIAGSVFHGKSGQIEIIDVTQQGKGSSAYSVLLDGFVDTVAGQRVTLQAMYREPTTGKAFAFSPPTHYDNDDDTAFAVATLKEDYQWSDLVYWVVSGLVYAEENGITIDTSVKMPVVNLFGSQLKQMLRDAVHAVGSFSEVYNRTLASTMPRSGGDLLNGASSSGPQQYSLPVS